MPKEREKVVEILKERPRLKEDFLDEIPANVDESDRSEWLLGEDLVEDVPWTSKPV
jgi:hypothetical protein